jgi:hypothetical protein
MKLIAIGAALLSGGVMATENEAVNEVVTKAYEQVKEMVQARFGQNVIETVKEEGAYPYPNDTFLSTLTEEQAFAITSAIDVVNAEYDWANMTDEEIEAAVLEVKAELQALHTELGIEAPMTQTRQGYRGANGHKGTGEAQGDQDGECDYTEPTGDIA